MGPMGCFGSHAITALLTFLETGDYHRPITKCLAHHGNPFWSLCPFNSILPILFVKKIGLGFCCGVTLGGCLWPATTKIRWWVYVLQTLRNARSFSVLVTDFVSWTFSPKVHSEVPLNDLSYIIRYSGILTTNDFQFGRGDLRTTQVPNQIKTSRVGEYIVRIPPQMRLWQEGVRLVNNLRPMLYFCTSGAAFRRCISLKTCKSNMMAWMCPKRSASNSVSFWYQDLLLRGQISVILFRFHSFKTLPPGKLTRNPKMEVWKIIFLFNLSTFRGVFLILGTACRRYLWWAWIPVVKLALHTWLLKGLDPPILSGNLVIQLPSWHPSFCCSNLTAIHYLRW